MAKLFGENTGKGFYKEEPLSVFSKAVESSIFKAPVREENKIYLSDLWMINSLPEDLIIEVLEKFGKDMNIPDDIVEILDDKRKKVIWRKG
jgi:hypothetical protein